MYVHVKNTYICTHLLNLVEHKDNVLKVYILQYYGSIMHILNIQLNNNIASYISKENQFYFRKRKHLPILKKIAACIYIKKIIYD